MSTRKPTKSPVKSKRSTVEAAPAPVTPEAPAEQAPRSNLAGVVLRVGAYKKPGCYRPYVKIAYDGVKYMKMVPEGRSATKEEALAKAEAYRAQIIADDRLPPRPERFGWGPGDITVTHADGTPVVYQ